MSLYRRSDGTTRYLEVCISGVSYETKPHTLLTYFEQFGILDHYHFTSPDGRGIVFITYANSKSLDRCMASRPHRIDGQHIFVKRAIPYNIEYPREHIDSTRDLLIVVSSLTMDEEFFKGLREYFSSYGILFACKLCHETKFDYVLVEFADYDQVDQIILDKPHFFNDKPLNLMKCTPTNKLLTNLKYSSEKKDLIDNSIDKEFMNFNYTINNNSNRKKNDSFNDIDLEDEVNRLQNLLKQANEEFHIKRQQLEDDYCEQLRKLHVDANKTQQSQQDLEQEHAKLLADYESLKHDNEALNEQYIQAELENFELTSYYEQILIEEKAKIVKLEVEYTEKLRILYANDSTRSSSSRIASVSQSAISLSPPAIPDIK